VAALSDEEHPACAGWRSRWSPRASVSSRSARTSPFHAAPRRSRTAASKHNCLQSVRSLQAQKGGRYRSSGEAALCCRRHPRVAILPKRSGIVCTAGTRPTREPRIDQSVVRAVTGRLDRVAIPARSRASRLTHARSARSRIVTWASATAPAPWVPGAPTRSVASRPWTPAVWIVLTIHDDEVDRNRGRFGDRLALALAAAPKAPLGIGRDA
jgi:hypothetical protein